MQGAEIKHRDPFIDLARLIAIFLIIVGHANELNRIPGVISPLLSIITNIASYRYVVFIFFLFAGYFAKPSEKCFNIRRTVDIFIPFAFYCVLGSLVSECLLCYYSSEAHSFEWGALISAMGSMWELHAPGNHYMWFLKVLMVFVFVSPVLLRMRPETLLIIGGMFYLGSLYLEGVTSIPYFLQSKALNSGCYFVGGIFLRKCLTLEKLSQSMDRVYLPAFVLLSVLALLAILQVTTLSWAFIPLAGTCLMCVYVMSLSKLAMKIAPRVSLFCAQFGKCTFFVYAIHYILLDICWTYFSIHPIHKHVYGMLPFLFVGIAIALFYVIRKFAPGLSPYLLFLPAPDRKTKTVNQTN